MTPKKQETPTPPQPAQQNAGIQEDKVIEDPVTKRRDARASLRTSYLTAPAAGVGVQP